MKKFRASLAVVLGLLLVSVLSSNGQSIYSKSYDPVGDSLAIQKYRERLDRIRQTRPTVALVLSGGGAKGAAHVGVIKYLEELGIPVDVVLGTSMGGLVGGLYSVGYQTEYMDSILRSMDWNKMMTDAFDKDYYSYSERKYRDKYVFSMPFFYDREDYIDRLNGDKSRQQLHIGAEGDDGELDVMSNIVGSLPAGYIHGRNVSNTFGSLTVGYQDEIDFIDLPIPYLCIATEMVSGKAKVWTKGKLNTALRSTMSIPGVFAPVRTDGMILVDGGLRNNYPTDFAAEMGADYIIGVDLSDADMQYSDINNIADIVWQATDIMGRDSFEKNVHIPDVKIKPDLTGYNMMSFSTENIDTIITRGYRAALAKADALAELRDKIGGPYRTELQSKPALDVGQSSVIISSVQYEGLTPSEIAYMEGRLKIGPWDKVTKADIEEAVNTIYGTRAFDAVTYELLGTKMPYILLLKCVRGPVHQLGLSGRFDSESLVSVMLNVGLNKHRIAGSSLNLTAKLASNPYLEAAYAYRAPRIPTFNVDFRYNYTDASIYEINRSAFNIRYWNLRQRVYLSDFNWKFARVRGGVKNEFFNISEIIAGYDFADKYNITGFKDDFVSAFVDIRHDNLDDGYFPKKGHNIALGYDYVLSSLLKNTPPLHVAGFESKFVFNLGQKIDFIPSTYGRFLFGEQIPVAYINLVGGAMQGRYLAHQIPFMGISYATPADNMLVAVGGDLRWNPAKNHYLSLKANALQTADSLKPSVFWHGQTIFGGGVEYAYDTIVGPLRFDLHWSNVTRFGAYLSIGFDF